MQNRQAGRQGRGTQAGRGGRGGQSSQNKTVKMVSVDEVAVAKIIKKYVVATSLLEASRATSEYVGGSLFGKIATLGAKTQNYELDTAAFRKYLKANENKVKGEVQSILDSGKGALMQLNNYLIGLQSKTRSAHETMSKERKKASDHNKSVLSGISVAGKTFSLVKWGADIGVSVVGSKAGPVGMAIGYGYNVTTELITAISQSDKVDLWTFKGSLTEPKMMALSQMGSEVAKSRATKASHVVTGLFATMDLKDNWDKFD